MENFVYTIGEIKTENGTAEIAIIKNSELAENAEIMLAAYDRGVLSFLVQQTAEEGINTFTDSRIDDTKTYKVFVWNSLGGMEPLADVK